MIRHVVLFTWKAEATPELKQRVLTEASNGEARIGYDLPSSIMSRYGNPELDAAARELDKKVTAFVAELTGSSA
jgi:hypothetical protein